ncbi:lisH domain and HEAT repeat-containing protein KIAA1468-like isoform X1 [Dinothrombium tinctorium]|uniref:LisH domain and HEAT repeat-containing protein KIAA1468-like isoform X1 n=1 Tax=Dinothrombium tinctorium TaxID=1965070 RepID=A0A443RCE5_9ACAR|nr:lisH domain and HEAT repeat-containing protein KIAA1468-like isoform X1 [Dinothrombium tinctorium]
MAAKDTKQMTGRKSGQQSTRGETGDISWDAIANKLIAERLHLTALELFAELSERGKELSVLSNFFSNPVNFEAHLDADNNTGSILERSSSLQTFDSLDFARNSEDGENRLIEDKIAVLEFELRKAKETITSLRANLTLATTNNELPLNTVDCVSNAKKLSIGELNCSPLILSHLNSSPIKPHEKRALNFLVNEYLMKNNYKMSSITFCDENGDQDFDNWEDVGLNIPQPPDISTLYRYYLSSLREDSNILVDDSEKSICKEMSDKFSQTERQKGESKSIQTESQIIDEISKNIGDLEENKKQTIVVTNNGIKNEEEFKLDTESLNISLEYSELTLFQRALYSVASMPIPSLASDIHIETNEDLIDLFAASLPQIISNIIINKRCEAIPLITYTCIVQSDDEKREQLLNLLLDLIKRPTKVQRQLILSAFVIICAKIGLQNRFLMKVCEQINSKYEERRILVAEFCSTLAPFVSPNIRQSLLCSLTQLIDKEKETQVLESSIKNLAILCSFLAKDEDDEKNFISMMRFITNLIEKWSFCSENINEFIKYQDQIVNLLVPSAAYWALHSKKFFPQLIEHFLNKTEEIVNKQDKSTLVVMLKSMNILVTFIFVYIVKQMPNSNINSPSSEKRNIFIEDITSLSSNLHQNLDLLLEPGIRDEFYAYVGKDWFKNWDELDWAFEQFLPKLITFIPSLLLDFELLGEMNSIVHKFCRFFNVNIVKLKVKPLFEKFFKPPFSVNEDFRKNSFANGYLVVYFSGIMSTLKELKEEDIRNEILLLHDALTTISLLNMPITSLEYVISFAATHFSHSSTITIVLNFLTETLRHSNPLVRKNIAKLFITLLNSKEEVLTETIIMKQVWPSLTSLSNDSDVDVRIASLSVFGFLLKYIRLCKHQHSYQELADKIYFQLQTFLEDPLNRDHYGIHLELIRVFENIANVITDEHKDFDELFVNFAIPRLAALAVECGSSAASKTKKQDIIIALIKTYSSFSKITLDIISDNLIREAILPPLKYIRDETKLVAPDYEAFTQSLINEFERRAHLLSPRASFDASSQPKQQSVLLSTSISFSPSLTSNAMVDDMKNRVRGILNKASPVSSAAKTNLTNLFQLKRK